MFDDQPASGAAPAGPPPTLAPPPKRRTLLAVAAILGALALVALLLWSYAAMRQASMNAFLPQSASTKTGSTTSTDTGAAAPETTPAPALPPSDAGTDKDHDGLFYEDELAKGTDPDKADTDGDGLADGDEVHVFGTDPLKADTDGDGFSDGSELKNGYDPLGPAKLTPEGISALKDKFRVNPLHQPSYDTLSGSPVLQ